MVVLPKTKEIDESIYNFLEQFDNYPDVMLDTDFAYYPDEYLITYAFVISRKHNEWFANMAAKASMVNTFTKPW